MEINSIDLMQSVWTSYKNDFGTALSAVSRNDSFPQCGKYAERIDISTVGKLRNEISQLSEDEREEMHTFHEEMMEAVKNGTFDASEMAANAPDTLKAMAEENGIDLETMLADQADRLEEREFGNWAPPPPPNLYGSNGYE